MNADLKAIYDKMISDPTVGISIKPTLGELIRRTNISQRPDRPTFFLGNDIMSTGKTFESFINDLISEHGSLIITPRKKQGSGVRKVDSLDAVEVFKMPTEKPAVQNYEPAVQHSEPAVQKTQTEVNYQQKNSNMESNGSSNPFGMNAAQSQYLELMRKGERADDWRDKADEYKDRLRLVEKKLESTEHKLKGEIESLILEKRDLQTQLSSIESKHEWDLKIQVAEQSKGLNSPVFAKLVESSAPLLAKMAAGKVSTPNSAPGMAGKDISESKSALINKIIETEMDDQVVQVLEIVGALMGNGDFLKDLEKLLVKYD